MLVGVAPIVYTAAPVATKCNPRLKEFYVRLRSNGKAVEVALVAIIRSLTVSLRRDGP